MVNAWNEHAARYLLATTLCPRCDAELRTAGVCTVCGADLRGAEGALVWQASQRAADAIRERERLIATLPTVAATAAVGAVAGPAAPVVSTSSIAVGGAAPTGGVAPAGVSAGSAADRATSSAVAAAPPTSQVSVQSVLAVAGAGLFAIAAIVFAFLNPDVGFAMRTTVIAVVTVLFLGGAWLLRRRDVRFSAEAIGALGMVFLALDIQALAEAAPPSVSGWVFAGIGTFVASAAMLVLAWVARIRSWLWAALVGLTVVPAFLGYAAGGWGSAWGHVGVVAIALVGHEIVSRAAARFGVALRADRVTLVVIQVMASAIVVLQLPFLQSASTPVAVLGRVLLLLALAALAVLSVRNGARQFWSYTAGALTAVAVVIAPLALERLDLVWLIALMPLAAALVLVVSGLLRGAIPVARPTQLGTLTVTLAVTLPAVFVMFGVAGAVLTGFLRRGLTPFRESDGSIFLGEAVPSDAVLAAMLGLVAVAGGVAVLSLLTRRSSRDTAADGFPIAMLVLALWLVVAALITLIGWSALEPLAQTLIGVVAAVLAAGAVLLPSSRIARAPGSIRAPFVVVAHLALVEAALISWLDDSITVPVGVVLAAALLLVARTVPAVLRPVHVAAAYAYALVLFATALDLAGVGTIAVLCLTTTLGALSALAATLVRRVDARSWYAILIVTVVPFLIGVASVLFTEPSAWVALSTGATFALALALLLTRRPGLNRFVRSAAAALLVPALAVIVVCLTSAFLAVSGSPVALPIIAAIVALTLPATAFIEALLVRRERSAGDAASARLWIEISALVTGAITVLLALVRDAAGLGTAVTVLVILGLGSAATRIFAGRRYGWWLAAISWTGAMWCVWAMLGVDVVEPYTLPPALAAATVAAVLVARRGRGAALFTSALACAIVPSLVMLMGWGYSDSGFGWRTLALLSASLVLLALAFVLTRGRLGTTDAARTLRLPLLAGALAAAAAGPIQAVRYGLELDPLALADPDLAMLPALGLSLTGAALALVAASLLLIGTERVEAPSVLERWILSTRWLFAPAIVFLAVGPIAAIRRDWIAIWSLWGLMAVFLALALITVALARRGNVVLPPFWFTYAVAWVTGVAGWSERDLRVEVFSLPLGLAVLAAGIIAMRPPTVPVRATLSSWPVGFTGSWRLLAPGIVLTFLPSVLATGTDPQLYRPILVIAFALVAILVGSMRKLAAPFILGLVVLPIENIVVFAAQIDRTVGCDALVDHARHRGRGAARDRGRIRAAHEPGPRRGRAAARTRVGASRRAPARAGRVSASCRGSRRGARTSCADSRSRTACSGDRRASWASRRRAGRRAVGPTTRRSRTCPSPRVRTRPPRAAAPARAEGRRAIRSHARCRAPGERSSRSPRGTRRRRTSRARTRAAGRARAG